jgi:hypothetical protein
LFKQINKNGLVAIIILICLSPFFVFAFSILSGQIYWSLFAPQILQDFHEAEAGQKNVSLSSNYHGQSLDDFRTLLEKAEFECKTDQQQLSCRFLTDTIMDEIYWIVDAQADETKHIIKYRGYIHSIF